MIFAEADAASGSADFVWVHLDLSDATSQAWLRRRAWPADVIEMVAAPIQRGRLFVAPDMVYDHLRDFRDEPGAVARVNSHRPRANRSRKYSGLER